jgi:NDP-sugar pyrophosphorylase family protein
MGLLQIPNHTQPSPATGSRAHDVVPKFGAVLLAAGLATRLGDIARDIPKAMQLFDGIPFLSLILDKLAAEGCTEAVVVVGHLAEVIENHIETLPKTRMAISATRVTGHGTGVALLEGWQALEQRQPFFCINTDTILEVDLPSVVDFHLKKKAKVTAVLTALTNVPHWGAVAIDAESQIVDYDESDPALLPWQRRQLSSCTRMSNCGHYCFDPSALDDLRIPGDVTLSVELNIMPTLTQRGVAYGYDNGLRTFLDFGTADRFRQAQDMADQVISLYPRLIPEAKGNI